MIENEPLRVSIILAGGLRRMALLEAEITAFYPLAISFSATPRLASRRLQEIAGDRLANQYREQ